MDGNATLTILTSTRDMNNAMLTVARIRQRRGSGVYDSALAAELGLTCTTLVDRETCRRLGRISPGGANNPTRGRALGTVYFQSRLCDPGALNHAVRTPSFACNLAIGHAPHEMRGGRTDGQSLGGLI